MGADETRQPQQAVGSTPGDKEKEYDAKLKRSFKWGLILSTGNLVYGYFMIASHLQPDARQNDWLLMHSPFPTYLATVLYVVGVTWLGPRLMKNREPFTNLRHVMVLYNVIQVIYSAYLVWEIGMGGWFNSYSFGCQGCDFSDSPQAIRMLHGSYWYYFSKFVDFMDTIFMVLHKKYDHISLLHVSHHALMPVSMWFGVRFQPGGHNTLMGLLNSLVHTVMYLYYCLAAMGPKVRPFLWWKKYLTSMQILQFTVVILHAAQLAFIECNSVPPRMTQWVAGNAMMFFFLFADFYVKSYKKKPQTKPKENGVIQSYSNGIKPSSVVPADISKGVSRRRGVPNGVADTTFKTIELCEKMAFKTQRGAI
ncbi:very long chain fatty acid elongase 7-like [Palaemon carinicauda]|uniref:very long chain fatty acid elongase 7-like n=1 Tax=Palaemon carinicauda TaxID=392227 RepID=UPI0035B5BFCA